MAGRRGDGVAVPAEDAEEVMGPLAEVCAGTGGRCRVWKQVDGGNEAWTGAVLQSSIQRA